MRNNPYWREGYKACDEGAIIHDCPYPYDTLERERWEEGYCACLEDML